MNYEMEIAGLKRQLPLCPISDDTSIGAFIIFGDVEMTVAAAEQLLARVPEFDVILAPEAKAIPLAYEMSRQCGKPYVVARKGIKLYMKDAVRTEVTSITTAKIQELYLSGDDVALLQNKKILLVDDVVSTGASIESLENLVEQVAGDNTEVVAKTCILAEGDAIARGDITYLQELPLFNADGTVKE